MSRDFARRLARGHVPQADLAVLEVTRRGQQLAVRREGHQVDPILVVLECGAGLARGAQNRTGHGAGRGEELAVGASRTCSSAPCHQREQPTRATAPSGSGSPNRSVRAAGSAPGAEPAKVATRLKARPRLAPRSSRLLPCSRADGSGLAWAVTLPILSSPPVPGQAMRQGCYRAVTWSTVPWRRCGEAWLQGTPPENNDTRALPVVDVLAIEVGLQAVKCRMACSSSNWSG